MFRKLLRRTPLAWLQLKREKTRLAVALAGIAFADVLMLVQLGLKDALYDSVTAPYNVLQGDLFIINPLFESLNVVRSFPRTRLYQAAGVEGVEFINSMYIAQGEWRNPQNRTNQTALVWGIDPNQPAISLPEVQQHQTELKLLNRVLYDRAGRENLFGDITKLLQQSNSVSIQFNNFNTKVIGTFVLGASFAADGNLITSNSTFLRLFPDRQPNQIDVGILNLNPNADIEQIQANLRATLPNDILVLTHKEFVEHEKKFWETNSPIGFIFGFGAIIGFVVGTVIVYQILYSDVSDHLPEYATLKAMGYTDRYLITVLIQESLILAVLGFIPGLALSTGLYYVAKSATLLPIGMTASRALTVLILTVVMCAASGGIAMRKLQAADPADIF
jgi:putative ABC transport system permease protein